MMALHCDEAGQKLVRINWLTTIPLTLTLRSFIAGDVDHVLTLSGDGAPLGKTLSARPFRCVGCTFVRLSPPRHNSFIHTWLGRISTGDVVGHVAALLERAHCYCICSGKQSDQDGDDANGDHCDRESDESGRC